MKKSLMLAAAAIAALSFSADASAAGASARQGRGLLGLTGRTIYATGLGPLGIVDQMTALGRISRGRSCTYMMAWESPYNPNDVSLCTLEEIRTPLNTSCIDNAFTGSSVPTAVLSGDFAKNNQFGMDCQGFDLLGVPAAVNILASSDGISVQGIVIINGYITLSLVI